MTSVLTTGDPSTLYAPAPAEGTKADGPARSHMEKIHQTRAIRALTADMPSVLYAVRLADGSIKIGCSANLAQRLRSFRGNGAEVLGFIAGDMNDEARLHARLSPHRMRAVEYYRPVPEVLAAVNEMRDAWSLPHLAA